MSNELNTEWNAFLQTQNKIEIEHKTVCETYHNLYERQIELKKKIDELLKQESRIKELAKGNNEILSELKSKIDQLKSFKGENFNSGGSFMELFLGRVNSLVFVGQTERRIQFKQEYEDFKYNYTLLHVPLVIVIGFVLPYFIVNQRFFDQLYQLIICYFYLTLAFRENILRVNGSNIDSWWIRHHYFSLMIVLMMLTWPLTEIYLNFRGKFYVYALYTSIIQIFQYKYQKRKLYIEKSLGKANVLDVPNSDSTPVHQEIHSSFMFLLPFIFIGHGIQFYGAFYLFYHFYQLLTQGILAEWQIIGVGIGFMIVAIGNFVTTASVFLKKLKKKTN